MDDNKCPICLENLIYSSSPIGSLFPCGHVFHETCFESWEKSSRGKNQRVHCPTCKTKCQFARLFLTLLNPTDDVEEDDLSDENETLIDLLTPQKIVPGMLAGMKHQRSDSENEKGRSQKSLTRRLRQKNQMLNEHISSLQSYKNQYYELFTRHEDLSMKYKDTLQEYEHKQLSYESSSVQFKVQIIKKDRIIEQLQKEKDILRSDMVAYNQNKEKEFSELMKQLHEANKSIYEYKQKCDRESITELEEIRKSNHDLRNTLKSTIKTLKEYEKECQTLRQHNSYLQKSLRNELINLEKLDQSEHGKGTKFLPKTNSSTVKSPAFVSETVSRLPNKPSDLEKLHVTTDHDMKSLRKSDPSDLNLPHSTVSDALTNKSSSTRGPNEYIDLELDDLTECNIQKKDHISLFHSRPVKRKILDDFFSGGTKHASNRHSFIR